MSDVALQICEALSPLFLAGLAWLAALLAKLIRAQIKSEYLKATLLRLDDAVLTAVREIEQTVVAEIKKANADGKLTDGEKAEVKNVAMTVLKSHLGPKGLSELMKVFGLTDGSVASFLSSKIESAVYGLPSSSAIVAAPAPGSDPLP